MAVNKLHFFEINWVIYFPSTGNEERPLTKYGVAYRDRTYGKTQPGKRIDLIDVLSMPLIKNFYPHTIGWFKESSGKGRNWKAEYIDIKRINNEHELLEFIKEIELGHGN